MASRSIIITAFILTGIAANGQSRLGINTTAPVRELEVKGSEDQHIRVHSTSAGFGAEAGVEFVRGPNNSSAPDWRIVNDGGVFRIMYGDDNFTGAATEVLRVNASAHTGIGTNSPSAKLNIDGGSLLAFGGEGYLKVGNAGGYNIAFDNNQIQAQQNGLAATLHLQANGGNTNFGLNGGNTYMSIGGGAVGAGTNTPVAMLSIADDQFQMSINNDTDDDNTWHIGSSNDSWQAGGHQLLFSPSGSSDDAVLRLMDVSDNDGTNAPVMIHTTQDHTLLLDGNEIDTRGTPLYINHNTDEETYINPSGGRVGVGTTNPQAMLHVYAASGNILALQNNNALWYFNPLTTGTEDLGIYWSDINSPLARVDGVSGQWSNISDLRVKEKITPMYDVLPRLMQIKTYHYSFTHDSKHQMMTGILAQEAESLFPEIVKVNQDQYGVSYSQLAAIGIKAIQEQQDQIIVLKEKINRLRVAISKTRDVKAQQPNETDKTN